MRNSFIVYFLYKTIPGRLLLKLLVQPKVSNAAGHFLSSGASRWLIPYYIKKHKIDMRNIDIPSQGFLSFNDFFIRKKKIEYCDITYGHLISPCDGLLSILNMKKNIVFSVKNTKFTLGDLLKDDKLAKEYENGAALVFRLTPADYHRYCYAASGRVLSYRKIEGKLHCVRPAAIRQIPVFIQNSREYQVIETALFGKIIQMEIGALLVGRIKNHNQTPEKTQVYAGNEKGYFEFGGSTIIILLKKDKIRYNSKLYKRRNSNWEMQVYKGEFIGKANR